MPAEHSSSDLSTFGCSQKFCGPLKSFDIFVIFYAASIELEPRFDKPKFHSSRHVSTRHTRPCTRRRLCDTYSSLSTFAAASRPIFCHFFGNIMTDYFNYLSAYIVDVLVVLRVLCYSIYYRSVLYDICCDSASSEVVSRLQSCFIRT